MEALKIRSVVGQDQSLPWWRRQILKFGWWILKTAGSKVSPVYGYSPIQGTYETLAKLVYADEYNNEMFKPLKRDPRYEMIAPYFKPQFDLNELKSKCKKKKRGKT